MRMAALSLGWIATLAVAVNTGTGTADGLGKAIDPFASGEDHEAAARATAKPRRYALETHELRSVPGGKPESLTFRLNTASGTILRLDETGFVDVSPEPRRTRNPEAATGASFSVGPELHDATARRRMESIILPEVVFREAALEDVMKLLTDASAKHDPEGNGFAFAELSLGPEPEGSAHQAQGSTEPSAPMLISFTARRVPLYDVMSVIASYAQLTWKAKDGVVVWSKGQLPAELRTQTFWVTDATARWLAAKCDTGQESARPPDGAVAVSDPPPTGDFLTVGHVLNEFGVHWPRGASAVLRPDVASVTITTAPEGLATAQSILEELDCHCSKPGRFRLQVIGSPSGADRLLLSDAETGCVWEYRTGRTSADETNGADAGRRFVEVEEQPRGRP